MGMDVGSAKGGPRSEINVTPFVDVVLVLLIIFMVLTPLVLREIGVTIPRKADAEVTADVAAQQVVLHLAADGTITLAGRPVALDGLRQRVRQIFSRRRQKLLFVRVDDAASYGLAVGAAEVILPVVTTLTPIYHGLLVPIPLANRVDVGMAVKALDIVDEIIPEPLGGAHHDYKKTSDAIKRSLNFHLKELMSKPSDILIEERYQKLRKIGSPQPEEPEAVLEPIPFEEKQESIPIKN